MRRSVPFHVVLWLMFYTLHTFGADWTTIAEKLSKSVVFIQNKEGSCTGFVIHAAWGEKKDKDLVMTAAHCYGPELYVDQEPARVVAKDDKKDLMVVEIEDTGRPALKLAKSDPVQGQELASFGFGGGLERPMFRHAMVSDAATYIPEDGIGGPLILIDAAYVPGQSGGPCINAQGEVVSIVQRANSILGVGVGAETIKSKMGRYFQKDEPKH